jgi:hypothetical protein
MDKVEWYNKKRWLILSIFFAPLFIFITWKNDYMKTWLRVVLTLPMVLLIWGILKNPNEFNKTSQSTTVSAPKVEMSPKEILEKEIAVRKERTVSSADLFGAYQENEVLGDKNFKEQYLYVYGEVTDIKKDIMNNAYITLATSNQFMSVQCFIQDENDATKVSKGDVITFYGKCRGLVMMNVLMKDCKMVENLGSLEKQLKELSK